MGRSLRGQVVVVTGASSGIGRAIAHAFAEEGCVVALLARNEPALQTAAEEVRVRGGVPFVRAVDIADSEAVDDAAEAVVAEFGRIDVWVNDAMVTALAPAEELRADEFERITRVNYLGAVHGTLAALRDMRARDDGMIIQIGSALAYRSIPLQSAYCATKAAMRAFTDSVRSELFHQKSRVRICMLQLPAVNTPQFDVGRNRMGWKMRPVGKVFQPELIGRAAVWAAKKRLSRELIIAGTALEAVFGQKLIGAILDRVLAFKAWDGQMTWEPEPPRRDNLRQPVPYDPGTHGRFDAIAHTGSTELWLRTHRLPVALAAVGAALGAGLFARRSWSR